MRGSFADRNRQHEEAVGRVTDVLNRFGFACFTMGTETDSDALYNALASNNDDTSRLLRFRPDCVYFSHTAGSVLCEIKSGGNGGPSFAVEADSFWAMRMWGTIGRVMVAFWDVAEQIAYAHWARDIPAPAAVYVPKRDAYEQSAARMRVDWPAATIQYREWKRGAGTPYVRVPKTRLVPLSQFVERSVMGGGASCLTESCGNLSAPVRR